MWRIEDKNFFLKELAQLPSEYRISIEKLVFEDIKDANPFNLNFIEKLKGYKDKYKIRMGNYRIGLTLNKQLSKIIFERVAHRKEIYRKFP